MKKIFKIGISERFSLLPVGTHNEKNNTFNTNCHFFSEFTTNMVLKPIVIFPKIDN